VIVRRAALFILLFATPAMAADARLSPRAAALVAPVRQAYEKAHALQARLPPPKDTPQTLLRLEMLDQAGREVLGSIDLSGLSKEEADAAKAAINRELDTQDLANQQALKALLPPEGWFRVSIYGKDAARAAFLIVQHAVNNPALMRTVLAKMTVLLPLKEVDGEDYALLYDRVALIGHKPQRYGSQVRCVNGKVGPDDLEDPAHVDARRNAVGMKETEAQYLTHFPPSC
jgi:hypothetical protein